MSREGLRYTNRGASFPRVSGDEPRGIERVVIGVLFSPRERG